MPQKWNQTSRDYPRNSCIHRLFEEQAERTPDAPALVCRNKSLTYRELNVQANQLAHYLRRVGISAGTPVAVYLGRSTDYVASVLGVLKAGGVYVPLALDYPESRLQFMVRDCGAAVILADHPIPLDLDGDDITVIDSGRNAADIADCSETNPECSVAATDLCYIMYTSGSTGRPKGVAIPHRGVVRLVRGQDYADFSPGQRFLCMAPTSFDASTFEIWGPLLNGGTCVIFPQELPDFVALERLTCEQSVNCLWFTAGLFNQIVDQRPSVLGRVNHVLTGGDVLSITHVQRALQLFPKLRLTNGYGPTEATTFTCTYEIPPGSEFPSGSVPIGRPLANTQCYILDEQRRPAPVGTAGELYIGGDGLANQYWNDPALTAERFIPDPFSSQPEGRLYRTGDFARYQSDGMIEFLGRRDQQVKIRGFRIELGEIESTLAEHPDISICAVVAREQTAEKKALIAFVVPHQHAALSAPSLCDWLRTRLPDYMLPAGYQTLNALPLTPNGKLDRLALQQLSGRELEPGRTLVEPRNDLEHRLVTIWQDLLGRERIGIHDNYFHLGGNSLLALTAVARIGIQLNRAVPVRWLFDYPTVAELATRIQAAETELKGSAAMPARSRDEPLPVSFGQQRMWLLQQTTPDVATYNVPAVYRLRGRVDSTRLQECLRLLLKRHEILRTAVARNDEELVQRVLSADSAALPWRELYVGHLTPSQLEQQLSEEVRQPFDLAQAPLWRALWAILDTETHVLALTFHHSVVDEWSLRVFFQELEQLYAGDGDVAAADLPALSVQYADYAVWQREQLQGDVPQGLRSYWTKQLAAPPPTLDLPSHGPPPAEPSGRGGTHHFQLPRHVVQELRQLSQDEGATPFSLMLATYLVWLYRYTGQPDLIVGTPASQREPTELQNSLGFFLNTLPIRAQLDGKLSFREVLARTRQTVLGALEHAALPFEQIVELVNAERFAGKTPIYQTMFVLVDDGLQSWSLGPTGVQKLPVDTGTSKCDLQLTVTAEGEEWSCELEYAADLFTPHRVSRMAVHWLELLRSITAEPDQPIAQLNLLPDEERHRLVVEWNQTARDYPRDKCVHQLFEEQVQRTPEALAVTFEDQQVAYSELNRRANQLAHHLRGLGVAPDSIVGVCLQRSPDLIATLLGILKAGGAYVALDPAYPADRLALLLADSQAQIAVTQESLCPLLANADIAHVVRYDQLPEGCQQSNPQPVNTPSDLAYVIYTSGSTGTPKGVAIEHCNTVSFLHWVRETFSEVELSGVMAATSTCFDLSVFEIFGPLSWGGCVILVAGPTDLNSDEPWANVTLINSVPSVMETLLSATTPPQTEITVNLAGEPLTPALVNSICGQWPTRRVNDLYGPSETTTYSTWITRQESGPNTIGKPIANTQIYLLDAGQEPVPVGNIGEIYIGGAGVARGYLHQPELTAERFLPDPLSANQEGRFYRTGDLARWHEDGTLEFLGRRDQQVKIRGFRIELGEIEAVLGEHPDISACAVATREHSAEQLALMAFVVPHKHESLSAQALRDWLRTRLPDFMLPAGYQILEALPLTPHGKVDRNALQQLTGRELAADTTFAEPKSDLQRQLAGILEDLLGRKPIGIHDNFFHLGGHSLLAVQMVSRIHRETGVMLPLKRLFEDPTIHHLAMAIAEERQHNSLVASQQHADERTTPPVFLLGWYLDEDYLGLNNRRSYVLPFPDFEQSSDQCRVEFLAQACLDTLRSILPHGPYILVGYSLAGSVAYEMACRLRAENEEVALLAIIDTAPASWAYRAATSFTRLLGTAAHLDFKTQLFLARGWYYLFDLGGQVRMGGVRRTWNQVFADFRRAKNRWRARRASQTHSPDGSTRQPSFESANTQAADRPFGAFWTHRWAHCLYRPQPYDGLVALFASDELITEYRQPGRGWERSASRIQECQVPGTHGSCIAKHKDELARKLHDCLAALDGPGSSQKRRGSAGTSPSR